MRNGKQDGKGETSMKDDVSGIGKRKNGIHSRAEGGKLRSKGYQEGGLDQMRSWPYACPNS